MAGMYQGDGVMKPTLGRIVHYLELGQVMPALIVHVHNTDIEGMINIVAWNETGHQMQRFNVCFSKLIAVDENHWFWPPMPKPTADDMKKLKDSIIANQQKVETLSKGPR